MLWIKLIRKDIISLPEECHVEGGDVMPWNDYIFIGTYSGDDYADYITAEQIRKQLYAIKDYFLIKL